MEKLVLDLPRLRENVAQSRKAFAEVLEIGRAISAANLNLASSGTWEGGDADAYVGMSETWEKGFREHEKRIAGINGAMKVLLAQAESLNRRALGFADIVGAQSDHGSRGILAYDPGAKARAVEACDRAIEMIDLQLGLVKKAEGELSGVSESMLPELSCYRRKLCDCRRRLVHLLQAIEKYGVGVEAFESMAARMFGGVGAAGGTTASGGAPAPAPARTVGSDANAVQHADAVQPTDAKQSANAVQPINAGIEMQEEDERDFQEWRESLLRVSNVENLTWSQVNRLGTVRQWANQILGQEIPDREGATISAIDVRSGERFSLQVFSFGNMHLDVEPLARGDTEIVREAFGDEWDSWSVRPVLVTIGDRTIPAAIHGKPHSSQSIPTEGDDGNGMSGHLCLHFSETEVISAKQTRNAQEAVEEANMVWGAILDVDNFFKVKR